LWSRREVSLRRISVRGDNLRSIDDIVLIARQMGIAYAYLTEEGTDYQSGVRAEGKSPFNNLENASKIVQYYVTAAFAGAYMGNASGISVMVRIGRAAIPRLR
jgi:hypothetical protein